MLHSSLLFILTLALAGRSYCQYAQTGLFPAETPSGKPSIADDPASVQSANRLPLKGWLRNYNFTTNTWAPDSATISYRYDAAGLLLRKTWYSSFSHDSSSKEIIQYDAAGNDTSHIWLQWVNRKWEPLQMEKNRYDANGWWISDSYHIWIDSANLDTLAGDSVPYFRQESGHYLNYEYDSLGRMTAYDYYSWDALRKRYDLSSKAYYTYNGTDRGYSSVEYRRLSSTTGSWDPETKRGDVVWWDYSKRLPSFYKTYKYIGGGNFQVKEQVSVTYTSENEYEWLTQVPNSSGNLANSERTTSWLDGDTVKRLYQSWNGTSWKNQDRYTKAYDSHGTLIFDGQEYYTGSVWRRSSGRIFYPLYYPNGDLMQVTFDNWASNLNRWYRSSRERFGDYWQLTRTQPIMVVEALRPYPSPASACLMIGMDLKSVQVSDAAGKVHSIVLKSGKADVSALKPGLYQIRAVGRDGKVQMGRFVKE